MALKVKINKNKYIDKELNLAREFYKSVVPESDSYTSRSRCAWNGPQKHLKEIGRNGNLRKNGDHLAQRIIKIRQNTEKRQID